MVSGKHITAWLTDKLYHIEVGEPRAWTMAMIYVVSRLQKMKKYESTQATCVVCLGGGTTYLLLIVMTVKGSTSLFVPWIALC